MREGTPSVEKEPGTRLNKCFFIFLKHKVALDATFIFQVTHTGSSQLEALTWHARSPDLAWAYYPLPLQEADNIRSLLIPGGPYQAIDPCAGGSSALLTITQNSGAHRRH